MRHYLYNNINNIDLSVKVNLYGKINNFLFDKYISLNMSGFAAVFVIIILVLIISSCYAWYNNNKYNYDYQYDNYPNNRYQNYMYENFDETSPVTVGTLAKMPQEENPGFADNVISKIPDVIKPALRIQNNSLTTPAYPMFADSLPADDIVPVDDMTYVSDNYLKLGKKYKFDGNKLVDFPADYFLLDDAAQGNMSTSNNICSKSCCAPQWPVPFKTAANDSVCNNPDLIGTNYMCNSTFQNAGCMCMTKNQIYNLSTRGGNAGKDVFVY